MGFDTGRRGTRIIGTSAAMLLILDEDCQLCRRTLLRTDTDNGWIRAVLVSRHWIERESRAANRWPKQASQHKACESA